MIVDPPDMLPGLAVGLFVGLTGVAADIPHAVPIALIVGLRHWYFGLADVAILGSLLAGSIPGIVLRS